MCIEKEGISFSVSYRINRSVERAGSIISIFKHFEIVINTYLNFGKMNYWIFEYDLIGGNVPE